LKNTALPKGGEKKNDVPGNSGPKKKKGQVSLGEGKDDGNTTHDKRIMKGARGNRRFFDGGWAAPIQKWKGKGGGDTGAPIKGISASEGGEYRGGKKTKVRETNRK